MQHGQLTMHPELHLPPCHPWATRLWRLPIVTLLLPIAIRLLLPIAVWLLLLLLTILIWPLLLLLHHHCNQALLTLTRGCEALLDRVHALKNSTSENYYAPEKSPSTEDNEEQF